VRAIASLAHSVGLEVIAEGGESERQLERIRLLECDPWQGDYCCPPLPAGSLEALLAELGAAASPTGLIEPRGSRGGPAETARADGDGASSRLVALDLVDDEGYDPAEHE
jgi:predicted signal transduction protein with EAL and GGDEF domain